MNNLSKVTEQAHLGPTQKLGILTGVQGSQPQSLVCHERLVPEQVNGDDEDHGGGAIPIRSTGGSKDGGLQTLWKR